LLNWIADNKEWLFSGVGVTIVILVGRFLIRRFRGNRDSAQPHTSETRTTAPSPPPGTLTPEEIRRTIDSAPLLLEEDVRQQFVGVRVSWKGTLQSATREGEDSVVLLIHAGTFLVVVVVQASRYPGIGLLKKGASVNVRGAIKAVEKFVYLTDAEIDFLP
jgi:hypothetical protein